MRRLLFWSLLGFLALSQAVTAAKDVMPPHGSVLLQGIPTDDLQATASTLSSQSAPQEYMHPSKEFARQELFKCLDHAAEKFDQGDTHTWTDAAEAMAFECMKGFLHDCHDMPGVAEKISNIPTHLLLRGIKQAASTGDLTHATLVFKAYLAGAGTQGSCATRLKGILGEGCFHVDGGEVMIHSLAKVLVQTLKATLGHGADAALGDCVADIPAVLLSLASSYCKPNPETPTTGALYDATTNTNVPCTPDAGAPLYELGAGPQLMGSVLSLLLLSGHTGLMTLGSSMAFAANRMALAATQTDSYTECIRGADDFGSLAFWLKGIPTTSGLPGIKAPVAPTADGIRVLCATIAAHAGESHTDEFLPASTLIQGAVDVVNAIALAVQDCAPELLSDASSMLCQLRSALFTFVDPAGPTKDVLVGPVPEGARDFTCMTDAGSDSCYYNPDFMPWGFYRQDPILAQGHSLAALSPSWKTCTAPEAVLTPLSGGRVDTNGVTVGNCAAGAFVTGIKGQTSEFNGWVATISALSCSDGSEVNLDYVRTARMSSARTNGTSNSTIPDPAAKPNSTAVARGSKAAKAVVKGQVMDGWINSASGFTGARVRAAGLIDFFKPTPAVGPATGFFGGEDRADEMPPVQCPPGMLMSGIVVTREGGFSRWPVKVGFFCSRFNNASKGGNRGRPHPY